MFLIVWYFALFQQCEDEIFAFMSNLHGISYISMQISEYSYTINRIKLALHFYYPHISPKHQSVLSFIRSFALYCETWWTSQLLNKTLFLENGWSLQYVISLTKIRHWLIHWYFFCITWRLHPVFFLLVKLSYCLTSLLHVLVLLYIRAVIIQHNLSLLGFSSTFGHFYIFLFPSNKLTWFCYYCTIVALEAAHKALNLASIPWAC